jgi:hypothetical protein
MPSTTSISHEYCRRRGALAAAVLCVFAITGCADPDEAAMSEVSADLNTDEAFDVFGFQVGMPLERYAEYGAAEIQPDGRQWIAWNGNRLVGGSSLLFPSAILISVQLWSAGIRVDEAFLRVEFPSTEEQAEPDEMLSCNGRISGFITRLSADLGGPDLVFWGTAFENPKAVWRNDVSKLILEGKAISEASICVAEMYLSDSDSFLSVRRNVEF